MEAEVSSLEELIQHATSPQNAAVSTAAVGAFVEAVRHSVERNGESTGDITVEGSPATSIAHAAAKLIAAKVQSPIEWEALQALNVLEACMGGCGPVFRAEVGKFRFLNELIKLVSPKYLGGRTPPDVQARVLALLRHWASVEGQNPPLPKVREAYAMLRKQGVVKDGEPLTPVGTSSVPHPSAAQAQGQQTSQLPVSTSGSILPGQPQRPKAAAFEDEHLSRLLQRLLQSKHPRDIQDANRLIKAMVRQEEMRAERRSRRATELESARTSARLLWEMLESWSRDGGGVGRGEDEKELMAELHASCGRIAQILPRLASEAPDEATMAEVLQASDELNKAMDKYTAVMVRGDLTGSAAPGGASLLDLSTPSEEQLPPALLEKDLANLGIGTESKPDSMGFRDKELHAVLGDLFGGTSDSMSSASVVTKPAPMLVPRTQTSIETSMKTLGNEALESGGSTKTGGLNDLDALGESLLKQSLPPSTKPAGPLFNKVPEKIPMNLLGRASSSDACKNPKNDKDQVFPLIGGSGIFADSSSLSPTKESSKTSDIELLSDLMSHMSTTNVKASAEANSLNDLIGLPLSGAAKPGPVISPGKPLIPRTESITPSLNPIGISAFPSVLNQKSLASSIPNASKVPSAMISNAASPASAVTFPPVISPAHTNPPIVNKIDHQPTGHDNISSGMNLESLEGLVESVLMAGGSGSGNRQSDSEGVSFLENALKSLMHPKDVKEVEPNTVSEKSKRVSVDEEGLNGSGDDAMVSWSDGEAEVGEKKVAPTKDTPEVKTEETSKVQHPSAVKPIGDINIPLQRIRPGKMPPIVALAGEDGSSISVELRLGNAESGLDGRNDISVLVVTITSRLETPISNCLFQAVVPKGCRLRLLPASGTDLPAHNPFLPPAAITQVMLIASAQKEPIVLKWVLSYITEDEETATEMGEIKRLPLS